MKKRVISLVFATIFATTMLAGCGVKTDLPESGTVSEGTSDTASQGEESAEADTPSKYQTTYGSKHFDNVTITVELFCYVLFT